MADEISSPSAIARLMRCPSIGSSRLAIRDLGWTGDNEGTRIGTGRWPARPVAGPFDVRPLWRAAWPDIRQALGHHDRPGVLALALDRSGGLVGHAWVASSWKLTRSILVGRHSCCDLVLPGSLEDLSLRHLAVLVRGVHHDEASITVLDLRSGLGFSDESGRLMHAVRCEGPVFLRVGPLVLALLVTEQGATWPDMADDAYDTLPARVFLDEQAVQHALPGSPQPRLVRSETCVTSMTGLKPTSVPLVEPGEPVVAVLELRSHRARQLLHVGCTALKQGILIGRYERCDNRGLLANCSRISRVHALIMDTGDGPLLVDTGSTNGTEVEGANVREVLLEPGVEVELASELKLSLRKMM